jgi:hypothetical protein
VIFTHDVPGIFTNTAPQIYSNDAPVIFSRNAPLSDDGKSDYPSGRNKACQEEPCQKEG